jgi:hypothetical protein
MRLDTFLLADAVAAHNRKLFVHGGGISRVDVPEFPFTQTQIGLLVRFSFEAGDAIGEEHAFGLRFLKPDGSELHPLIETPVAVSAERKHVDGEEVHLNLAIQAGPIEFENPGIYRVEIYLDKELVRSAALPVTLGTDDEVHKTVIVPEPN